jgi:hypothetical protein
VNETTATPRRARVLLSGVFGPFGVDDEWGRKENIMELFHNQVTKGQGLASFRFHHRSFGLYFLAANVDADVTVLDFPTREQFEREVAQGYDLVGLSFIAPNFVKAREMARVTRALAPGAEIVLGGHGAAIEGVEGLIDCDHVVKGEGIRWLRAYLGQDPDAPIVHPTLPSSERMAIYGLPLPGVTANLLVPGVGCVNGCSFCSTTHFFGKRYTAFLETGRDLFETACRVADERGTDQFFVMDENFLKDRQRALELVEEMDRAGRYFRFSIFSSAEAIVAFGLDNMVRLGVTMVWIGFESQSRQGAFAKNAGIDARALVAGLRSRGIAVLASGILCMEHHTPANMQGDIDFLVGLEPDFVQFMLLTPLPVTALYERHRRLGWLDETVPLEETHGQTVLNWRHPAFGAGEPARWIERAFAQDYRENSSSMLRVADTALRGWEHLARLPRRDACEEARMASFAAQARGYCLMAPAIARFSVNPLESRRAQALDRRARAALGRTPAEHAMAAAVVAIVARWKLRLAVVGDEIQPRSIVTRYTGRGAERRGRPEPARGDGVRRIVERLPAAAAAALALLHLS